VAAGHVTRRAVSRDNAAERDSRDFAPLPARRPGTPDAIAVSMGDTPEENPMDQLSGVNSKNLDAAVHAALHGPERKKLKIARHEFNVKPVKITREADGRLIIDGSEGHHISHHISMQPDHQIMFKVIRNPDGSPQPFDLEISKWGPWIPVVIGFLTKAAALAKTVGLFKADGGVQDEVMQTVLPLLEDKSWEGEARFLITQIALRAT
jgi:hypothetical protein